MWHHRIAMSLACTDRLLVSCSPSLCRKNVELTNDQVVEIKEHSVLLQSGREIPCDVLVHANGFNSENFSLQMEINGPTGSLTDYVSVHCAHRANSQADR